MAKSVLSRYLNADVLGRTVERRIDPRGLVLGNLAGAHASPLSGFAVEFVGHRPYVWGDDPRHIDWGVYFRRDKYFVKQYEMETNFVCHLLLDASASMRYGQGQQQKLLYASRMAATLGYSIVRQSDKVSLATFDDRVLGVVPPSNSMAQIVRMAEHLDTLQPSGKTRLAECLGELLEGMGRREIVMVFSDFFGDLDALETVLQRMRYQRHEVVLFHVLHHDELAFDFDRMTRFVGLEAADARIADPHQVRRSYLDAFERFCNRFEEICQRNRVERVVVDTSHDMVEVFINYLNRRSQLNRGR
ncbi:MAG TPA: DUF58 domain-containing protein [Pirellulales bacterium]|jgi:uncharacterized protein (DUF58 family)|nr:DUF58 domain-containing protein [Pirellulales bacterium]